MAVEPKRQRAKKCLNCSCKPRSRGLCEACLSAAYRVIRQDPQAEQKLIDNNMILPKPKRGRPIGSAFQKRLAKIEAAAS